MDDILLFPVTGILGIFRGIINAAGQETASEAQDITTSLSELYMMLETGRISEQEFNAREKTLLEQLEKVQEHTTRIE
ncbi:MAG: gas vesicle protein GvpG [Planctomycetota bacterium]|nr:gas vesicle protein GvpG [Planctomycetota bacterium]